jgi:predicted peroxiredoxin
MKNMIFILTGIWLAMTACNPAAESTLTNAPEAIQMASDTARDGVFIHITECSSDPHRLLMPLKMATMMANDKDVLVYLDIHAVEIAVKGSKDVTYAGFESAHTYINALIEKKVGLYACPTCLNIAGYEPDDLREGIQVAQKDKFFNFTKGRILSLDY